MSSTLKSGRYLLHRYVLRSDTLLAKIPKQNLELRVKPEDVVGRHLYKYAQHEPENTAFLRKNLRFEPNDVVLDVGANIGWFSLICHRIAGDTPIDVFAFEPEPTNFELLERNVADNEASNVHAVRRGVGASGGPKTLYVYKNSNRGRHSLLPSKSTQTLTIELTSLDEFWEARALGDRVLRFVKMDIEGYELMAVQGAAKVLSRCLLLMLEYSPQQMKEAGMAPGDLIFSLQSFGLRPHVLRSGQLEPVEIADLRERTKQVDLFWTRES